MSVARGMSFPFLFFFLGTIVSDQRLRLCCTLSDSKRIDAPGSNKNVTNTTFVLYTR